MKRMAHLFRVVSNTVHVLWAGEWAVEEEEEEVIRCICGIYKDEGLMIQCEKCYVSTGTHTTAEIKLDA